VGTPDDVGRFRDVLALLREGSLTARRVQVGDINVEFAQPPPTAGAAHPLDRDETDAERKARLEREYDEIMYAASEGPFAS